MHHGGALSWRSRQIDRAAAQIQHYHRLAASEDFFHQVILQPRQLQIRLVAAAVAVKGVALFPFDGGVQPDAQHHDIRFRRTGQRLGCAIVLLGTSFYLLLEKMAACA